MRNLVRFLCLVCTTVALFHAETAAAATITVAAGGNLQTALNNAKPGDTILLAAGAKFTGNFTLPAKTGTAYIIVRSAAADAQLPAAGVRITPLQAALLPKIVAAGTGAAIRTATGAHHWRLQFLEIVANSTGNGDIVQLGRGSETVAANQAHHLTVDRVYIHGLPGVGAKRGIALNSAETVIQNSWISEIGKAGMDTQAICGWNGPGPFTIENNYLSAAAENIMFGGADPAIPNLVPSDIIIRRNLLTKDLKWRTSTWWVKNLLEVKNARRVLVEGNRFEYSYAKEQKGYAVNMKPVNGGRAPWTTVEDVTIQYNHFDHVAGGFTLSGIDKTYGSKTMARIMIRHNLLTDVSSTAWGGSGGFVVAGSGVTDLTVDHNTVIHNGFVVNGNGSPAMQRFVYTNNLSKHGTYGIYGDGLGAGLVSINKYFPGSTIRRNVMAGGTLSRYPSDNFFPPTANFLGNFVDAAKGNYRLGVWSPYTAAGTDGKAIGADIDTLAAKMR